MVISSVISFAIFGLVLGISNGPMQAFSSMLKLPLLFLATLAICLPTLYLFNLVFGARLSMGQAVTLIMVSVTVTAVLTLAFAPISLFFLITAKNYAFFKLLNVCILMLTAFVGLRFLTRGMAALNEHHEIAVAAARPRVEPAAPEPRELALVGAGEHATRNDGNAAATASPASATSPGGAPSPAGATSPAAHASRGTTLVARLPAEPPSAAEERPTSMALLYIWILLFGFVGTQLAWTLRPFFGDPNTPFAPFRAISGTFYSDIFETIGRLFGA
jgi:hypothetical protein